VDARLANESPYEGLDRLRKNTALTERDPNEYFKRGLALVLDGIEMSAPSVPT
jgi:hypothetical protein